MNRTQRRRVERIESRTKSGRRKQPRQDSTAINPVITAVIEADCKAKFSKLKTDAEVHCLASDDAIQIAYNAGLLLFITLRALEIETFEIEDADVIEALAIMGSTLGDLNAAKAITQQQRDDLVTGMDYLDALVQPLSKEAVAIAWHQVDTAAAHGDIGTQDLDLLLKRLSEVKE